MRCVGENLAVGCGLEVLNLVNDDPVGLVVRSKESPITRISLLKIVGGVPPVSRYLRRPVKMELNPHRRATRLICVMGSPEIAPLCVEIPVYSTSRLLAFAEVMVAASGERKYEIMEMTNVFFIF